MVWGLKCTVFMGDGNMATWPLGVSETVTSPAPCPWFRVQGTGFRFQGSGCRVQVSGFRVQGSGCRVQGFRTVDVEGFIFLRMWLVHCN